MKSDTTPNSFVPGAVELPAEMQTAIARRGDAMGPAYRLSYARPVAFVRGQGVWLYDRDGNGYLDFYNNVVSLGHCHPRVVEAMHRQAALLCTNTRYLHDSVIQYSERLTRLFPAEMSQVMFCCSGSEANDLAFRIARHHTGGEGIIVTEHAYHGTTHVASGMSPNLGVSVPLNPNVRTVQAPADCMNISGREQVGRIFARDVQNAAADLRRQGIRPAALIVDTLFSSDGVFPDPSGFLAEAVDAIRAAGGLFIADEVQPGFARTGDAMWGFERHGVVPDIATLGKPMGNGYPMAGLVVRPDVVESFGKGARYFNTFAGNSVAAENGLAVLDVIRDEALLENSATVGAYLKSVLTDIADDRIASVRGAGLFVGVEMRVPGGDAGESRDLALGIVNALRDRRVLISTTGKYETVLKIRPPLVTTSVHVDRFMEAFAAVLKETG
ncbi:aspartate aminotransferase family protein [Eilatimonas milleporae]|uniref:4-aminobutyrate aminotransferase-like enzyme n=1 Tax=Eilatimonas milleporae TaxID=911205 RepID=A0A3M0CDX9_9PROT|nr:aminotransferase class III-fold pyridoxal phosphate-dependent enzyme [Eilatimonas milleporae]RMB04946.1 4-aminobutyrate aminotransferase-like enzyme [Eilatimonas milleporae]